MCYKISAKQVAKIRADERRNIRTSMSKRRKITPYEFINAPSVPGQEEPPDLEELRIENKKLERELQENVKKAYLHLKMFNNRI